MTALHARITRTIHNERQQAYVSQEDRDIALATAVINDLREDGYAIVKLPEPMEDRSGVAESLRPQPMWEIDGSWTCLTAPDCVEFEAAHQTEYGTVTVKEARSLAAALLAAAEATND